MKKKIAIYGAGGLGREVLSMLRALPEWEISGFYDDGIAAGQIVAGLPVFGTIDSLMSQRDLLYIVLAMGDPQVKRRIAEKLSDNQHILFPSLIHPSALIQDVGSVLIGDGSIITAGVIITTQVRLGKHVMLNLNCTVGHDVSIDHYSSVMPGVNIAGAVRIGQAALIGSGANILNGLTVGNFSRVGAGAVVTHDVMEGSTVVGVPARPILLAS